RAALAAVDARETALRGLVEKWRQISNDLLGLNQMIASKHVLACTNELAAVLNTKSDHAIATVTPSVLTPTGAASHGGPGPDATKDTTMNEALIRHMANRFLCWKLPGNFSPDGGISFDKIGNSGTPHAYTREPVGTNLLDAAQAEEMVRHMLEGWPVAEYPGADQAPATGSAIEPSEEAIEAGKRAYNAKASEIAPSGPSWEPMLAFAKAATSVDLPRLLAEAKRKGMERAAEIAENRSRRSDGARGGLGQAFAQTQDHEARNIAAAIRAAKDAP
ncbi:hypothetical protein, partial [Rhodoblastus sp.]|uniref:hypothetical protein n=1 Tax=Rhodoblastus sp. TaxID=1962975 RepID=UPI002621E832